MEDVINASVEAMKKAKSRKHALSASSKNHVCYPETCHPENEPMLIQQGLMSAPPLTTHVFLCNFRCIHICNRQQCHRYGATGACPISNIRYEQLYSSYDSTDPLTWKNASRPFPGQISRHVFNETVLPEKRKQNRRDFFASGNGIFEPVKAVEAIPSLPPPPPEKRRKKMPEKRRISNERQRIEKIVKTLLFSEQRKRLNENVAAEHQKQHQTMRDEYLRKRRDERQLPILSDLYRILVHYASMPLPLVELQENPKTVRHYTKIALEMLDKVNKYVVEGEVGGAIRVTSVVLGTLYMMRQGYEVGNVQVLPLDRFLLCNLPMGNDLQHFTLDNGRLEKSHMTSGERLVSRMYNNAVEQGASEKELTLQSASNTAVRSFVGNNSEEEDSEIPMFKSVSRKKRK
jgi:hypothetical protein